jgi:hypothetical protein
MLHTCLGLSHLPHAALLACARRCTGASAPPMCRYWPLRCRDKPPADKTMVAHRRLHSSHALPRHEPSHRACLDSFAPRHLACAHPCVATMALHHNHPRPNKPHTDNSHSLASVSRYHCHCQVLPWLQRADTAQASHLVPRLHGYKTPLVVPFVHPTTLAHRRSHHGTRSACCHRAWASIMRALHGVVPHPVGQPSCLWARQASRALFLAGP